MLPIFEQIDLFGNNCLDYIKQFQLYDVLGTELMQNFIDERWNGRVEINSSVFECSTPLVLMQDKYGLYSGDKLYRQLKTLIVTFDLSDKTYLLKFHVWKKSMKLRAFIESGFILVLTVFFQVYIASFNRDMHESAGMSENLTRMFVNGQKDAPEFHEELERGVAQLEKMSMDLQLA